MRITSVDFYYAALPIITTAVDGSQDALVVRVRAGDLEGWGECESSPLVSIAAFVTPLSHGVCQPVGRSVLGTHIEGPADIFALGDRVRRNSMDLLQAPHIWSGVEMALWDLLGKSVGRPVWALLGYEASLPKRAYASLLWGDTPEETFELARAQVALGFGAVKFGWGKFGAGTVDEDREQLVAARSGLGPDAELMVDAGQIWRTDVSAAAARIPALLDARVTWVEEPFEPEALGAYAALASLEPELALAGGEASHNAGMAENLIRFGRVKFVQIDSGRIGGIAPSKRVVDFAAEHGVSYVNHTFTSHLALSASLQSFAGVSSADRCEYPGALSPLATDLVVNRIPLDAECAIKAPDAPGLGIEVSIDAISPYLRSVDISVDGEALYPVR